MTTGRTIALTLLALASGTAPAVADDAFRCGSKLIEPGMAQSEVLAHCGEPTSKSVEIEDVRSGPRVVGKTPVSRWTYEAYSATHVLVFDGEKLVSIQ